MKEFIFTGMNELLSSSADFIAISLEILLLPAMKYTIFFGGCSTKDFHIREDTGIKVARTQRHDQTH